MNKNDTKKLIETVMEELAPLFTEIGFKRKGKLKFYCVKDGVEMRFILSIRYPKYSDDTNIAYVSPVVHLYFCEVEGLLSNILNEDIDKDFPTLGGNLGGFSEGHKYIELPIQSEADAGEIVEKIKKLIPVSLTFWDKYFSMDEIIDSYKKSDPLLPKDNSWVIRIVVMFYLSEGEDEAIYLLESNRKKLKKNIYSQLKNYLIKIKLRKLRGTDNLIT